MAPHAPFRPLPLGFFLAGMLSMFFTVGVLITLLIVELGNADVAVRGLCVLLASLGAIATESLWDARPSAYPASLALAGSWVVTLALWVARSPEDKPLLAVLFGLSACVVGPILVYLHRRSQAMWPTGQRIAVPRP
jgi:hypothetical protein